jgi:predicted Zn-ribbon and HTH transcriptional regulator
MSDLSGLRKIRRLIEALESDDAFERLRAIESLALLTQQRLDFAWRDPPEERSRAVRRWRRWYDREIRRRQRSATMELLATGDPSALQKFLDAMGPEQKKALLAQMLVGKVAQSAAAALLPQVPQACERCGKRPVTVKVTARTPDGSWLHAELCEVCAQ